MNLIFLNHKFLHELGGTKLETKLFTTDRKDLVSAEFRFSDWRRQSRSWNLWITDTTRSLNLLLSSVLTIKERQSVHKFLTSYSMFLVQILDPLNGIAVSFTSSLLKALMSSETHWDEGVEASQTSSEFSIPRAEAVVRTSSTPSIHANLS